MSKQPIRARLLDALVSEVVLPPQPARTNFLDQEELFQHNAALRQILTDATCIEATNVARFFDNSYLGSLDSFWTDLKCLVPPVRALLRRVGEATDRKRQAHGDDVPGMPSRAG